MRGLCRRDYRTHEIALRQLRKVCVEQFVEENLDEHLQMACHERTEIFENG